MRSSPTIFIHFTFFLLIALLTGCGSGGSSGSSSGDAVSPDPPKVSLLVATDTDKVAVAWLPSSDNATSVDALRYEVHASSADNFAPSPSSLKASVVGGTSSLVNGLEPATQYLFLVLAVDEAGNQSQENDFHKITTASKPVKRTSTVLNTAADLNLSQPTIEGSTYAYPLTDNAALPQVGSVIVGEDQDGRGYLRRVDQVTLGESSIVLQTSDASLTDLIEDGLISSQVTLWDIESSAENLTNAQTAGSTTAGNFSASRGLSSPSDEISRISLGDGILDISQTRYNDPVVGNRRLQEILGLSDTPQRALSRPLSDYPYAFPSDPDAAVAMGADIRFEPKLITTADISLSGVESALVVAEGVLGFDGLLGVNFKAEKSSTLLEAKLFSRTYTSIYLVGELPVYQEITFTVTAQLNAKAASAITAAVELDSAASVRFGLKYDGNNWVAIDEKNVDNALTYHLTLKGGVSADVRLVPNVEVKFYKVAAANLSVEPYIYSRVALELDVIASNFSDELLSDYNFTDFGAGLGLDINAYAQFKIIDKVLKRYPEEGSYNIFKIEYPLLSLPVLEWEASSPVGAPVVDQPSIELFAKVTDGKNNKFDLNSIGWFVYPTSGSLTPHANDKTRAVFTPGEEGIVYTIFFAGNSEVLGPIGQQYTTAKVDLRDDDLDGMPNDWETFYGLNPLLASDGEGDLDGDWLSNADEYKKNTRPHIKDTDQDGMWDGWEVLYGLDPLAKDETLDADGDALSNLSEFNFNLDHTLNPTNPDTDGDGLDDGWEVAFDIDPLTDTADNDPDNDGLTNLQEYEANSHPNARDYDGDGLEDPEELNAGTEPLINDTDGDGMWDGWEVLYSLNPLDPSDAADDPDGDGLTNLEEFTLGSNPTEGGSDPKPNPVPEAATIINLNDTGTTQCFDTAGSSGLDCPVSQFPSQDAETGRDSYAGQLIKAGGGAAGFDFTKLDATGSPLADQTQDYASQPWDCVLDNVTGLVWEIKKPDPASTAGFRYQQNQWSWYDSNAATNGGSSGTINDGYCYDTGDPEGACVIRSDTEAYIQKVNEIALCGYDDWRLPTLNELLSVAELSGGGALGTGSYFPHNGSVWTSTPYYYLEDGDEGLYQNVYTVDLYGQIQTSARKNALGNSPERKEIRLVRGAQW